jgi:DNA-binding response OmpR family regulator
MKTKGTILIVEDQKGFRRIYKDFFEGQGYEVLTAEDGEIGWNLIQEKKPQLILLDLGLPKLNGFEVLHKVRGNAATEHIRVIIFSVVGEEKEIDKAMAMGANDYTIKGFNTPRQVLEKIEAILSKGDAAPSAALPGLAQAQQA